MSKINVRNLSNENDDGAPDIVGVSTFSATSYFVPSRGTTAQRPSDHVEVGSLRYNYDTKNLEYYRGDTIGWAQFELIDPDLGGGTGSNTGLGTRGIFGGGTRAPAAINEIKFITTSTMGADQDFGDLTKVKRFVVGLADRTRGIFQGGAPDTSPFGGLTDMEFITHASTGDAVDFGDSGTSHRGAGCADQTRGVFTLGNTSPYNIIQYITIASAGSSQDFGDLSDSHRNIDGSGCSSSTRGIFAGSYTPDTSLGRDDINFVTISSTGNTTEFGTLSTVTFGQMSASSNSTRGIFAGGYGGSPDSQNTIQFITIASTGNTTDFGDLTNQRKRSQQVSSPTRAVIIGGGVAPSEGNVTSIEKVEILTTGASVDFGTLANGVQAAGYFSNGHGGL